jgi:hypothetical protein
MAIYDRRSGKPLRQPMAKAEFLEITGITPELEEFISEFVQRPEILDSLSQEKQREIEAKMDAVFTLLC